MSRHKVHKAGAARPETELERRVLAEIKALEESDVVALKRKWQEIFRKEPPRFAKRSFLTQALAWEIQARAFGGIPPALHRQLLRIAEQCAKGRFDGKVEPRSALKPGVTLVRSWRGTVHQVTVTEDGFLWKGESYDSLSVIAREITGTQWSGPRFFGLKKLKSQEPAAEGSRTSRRRSHVPV